MAEEPTPKAAPAAFDPTAMLGKLESIVNANKSATGVGSKSWMSTLIIIVVALAATAVWAWVSWRSGRELAKLRHEQVVTQTRAEQAVTDLALAKIDKRVLIRQRDVDIAQDKARVAGADLRAAEGRYEADRLAIARIRSWDDVP